MFLYLIDWQNSLIFIVSDNTLYILCHKVNTTGAVNLYVGYIILYKCMNSQFKKLVKKNILPIIKQVL